MRRLSMVFLVGWLCVPAFAETAEAAPERKKKHHFKPTYTPGRKFALVHEARVEAKTWVRVELPVAVKAGGEKGHTLIEMGFRRIQFKREADGIPPMTMDTAAGAGKGGPDADIFKFYQDMTIRISVDQAGKVVKATATGKQLDAMLKAADPDRKEALLAGVERQLVLPCKTLVLQVLAYLPREPVTVGQVWTVKRKAVLAPVVLSPQMGDEEVQCKLAKVKETPAGRVAVIAVAGKLTIPGGLPGSRVEMKGTGTVEVNMVKDAPIRQRMEMTGKDKGSGQMKIRTDTTLTPAPTKPPTTGRAAP